MPSRYAASKDFIEQKMLQGLASGQCLQDSVAQHGIAAAHQRGRAVLYHRDQFRWSLTGIERNHNQSLGHSGQVHQQSSECRSQPAIRSGRPYSAFWKQEKFAPCGPSQATPRRSLR
jgi:hypothetical protein